MAEKLSIEIFRRKDAEDFTKSLADPESRTDVGSGAAMTAAVSAAYLHRAAALMLQRQPENERLDWLARNSETLRTYMVNLIDEDVKCRGPLRRAIKEGDPQKIEAAHQPAVAIAQEILGMMTQSMEFLRELSDQAEAGEKTYLAASAELAMATMKACVHYIVDTSEACTDETYRFVIHRENEITMEQYRSVYEGILEKTVK